MSNGCTLGCLLHCFCRHADCAHDLLSGIPGALDHTLNAVDFMPQGIPSITLLYPEDASSCLGYSSETYFIPHTGLTCGTILQHIYEHYQASVTLGSHAIAVLQQQPTLLSQQVLELLRAGAAVRRSMLLGSRCAFEGLIRATRGLDTSVYEVCLCS